MASPGRPSKQDVARQFGRMAEAYATSPTHRGGRDLEILLDLLAPQPHERILDVATGAGHTAAAVAPRARSVIATDLAAEMARRARALAAERGLGNLVVTVSDGEQLAFAGASFDAVTCRVAPHHFLDVPRFLGQVARVLRRGGRFVLEDSCSPAEADLDRFLNEVERLRDPTHVRSYSERQWREMVASAGLRIEHVEFWPKRHDLTDWLSRAGVNPDVDAAVRSRLAGAPERARERFAIELEEGRATTFTDEKILLRARRPD